MYFNKECSEGETHRQHMHHEPEVRRIVQNSTYLYRNLAIERLIRQDTRERAVRWMEQAALAEGFGREAEGITPPRLRPL